MTSCYAIVRNYTDVRHFANKNLWPDQKQQEQLQQKKKQQESAQKLALVPELVEDEENGSEDYEGFGSLGFCVFANPTLVDDPMDLKEGYEGFGTLDSCDPADIASWNL
ncbi:hypothetical protein B0J14DRAFT_639241 [Halenospora varia]|nr:hypothetical protein B0J14DRAFT_639241 [Halenospora varia]